MYFTIPSTQTNVDGFNSKTSQVIKIRFLEYNGIARCVCWGGGYPCGKEVEYNINIYTRSQSLV